MTSVDAIIPTYNETERALAAVKSVRNQTYSINKIFVIDDGSPNQIRNYLEQNLNPVSNVELVSCIHSGHPGQVRQKGVDESEAHWIAFLDADDEWEKDKLARQLILADQLKAGLVFSNAWISGRQTREQYFSPIKKMPESVGTLRLLFSNPIINSSVIVRRDYLQMVGGYATSWEVCAVEDYATWLRLSTVSRIVGIREPLLTYSISETSFSRRTEVSSPTAAIRDFRRWLVDSNLPPWKKLLFGFMASSVLLYRESRQKISGIIRKLIL